MNRPARTRVVAASAAAVSRAAAAWQAARVRTARGSVAQPSRTASRRVLGRRRAMAQVDMAMLASWYRSEAMRMTGGWPTGAGAMVAVELTGQGTRAMVVRGNAIVRGTCATGPVGQSGRQLRVARFTRSRSRGPGRGGMSHRATAVCARPMGRTGRGCMGGPRRRRRRGRWAPRRCRPRRVRRRAVGGPPGPRRRGVR